MIKYRVYDKKRNKYLPADTAYISGNGTLTVVGIESKCHMSVQPPNEKSPRFIIEQYTGLEDKNGVEVASGDIVKRRTANYEKQVFEDEYGVVKYERGSFCVDFRGDRDNLILRHGEPEVIGNVNENAELLEEK